MLVSDISHCKIKNCKELLEGLAMVKMKTTFSGTHREEVGMNDEFTALQIKAPGQRETGHLRRQRGAGTAAGG